MIISSCTPLRLFFPFYLFIYPDYYFLSHYVKKKMFMFSWFLSGVYATVMYYGFLYVFSITTKVFLRVYL